MARMRSDRVPPPLARVAGPLALALGYFALSRLGLAFLSDGQVALLWPASGLALGVLVCVPRRTWPRYALAAFLANLAAQAWARGIDTPALGLAGVNALEPLLAAWTLQAVARSRARPTFESTREVAGLIAAATLANAVTAALGAAIVSSAFGTPFGRAWQQWWLADGLGMLAVAPVAMALRWHRPARADRGAVAFVAVAWLFAALICWQPLPGLPQLLHRSHVMLPLLLWVAVRYGARATAAALAGVAAIATSATVAGHGPFAVGGSGGAASAEVLQGFLAVAIVSTLFVASVVAERNRVEEELRAIVSERERFEHELRHLADHDPLTGLLNRRRFELELDRQLAQARRYGRPGAVVLLDVDRFKQINDTYGHSVGDRLIVGVADALRARLRGSDAIARIGGDEFAVLLPEIDCAGAEAVAVELVAAVAAHTTHVDGRELPRVTISVGVASFGPQAGLDREALVIAADVAMYRAKEAGRNRYAVADLEATAPGVVD